MTRFVAWRQRVALGLAGASLGLLGGCVVAPPYDPGPAVVYPAATYPAQPYYYSAPTPYYAPTYPVYGPSLSLGVYERGGYERGGRDRRHWDRPEPRRQDARPGFQRPNHSRAPSARPPGVRQTWPSSGPSDPPRLGPTLSNGVPRDQLR